jgi:hypothetical protein
MRRAPYGKLNRNLKKLALRFASSFKCDLSVGEQNTKIKKNGKYLSGSTDITAAKVKEKSTAEKQMRPGQPPDRIVRGFLCCLVTAWRRMTALARQHCRFRSSATFAKASCHS